MESWKDNPELSSPDERRRSADTEIKESVEEPVKEGISETWQNKNNPYNNSLFGNK